METWAHVQLLGLRKLAEDRERRLKPFAEDYKDVRTLLDGIETVIDLLPSVAQFQVGPPGRHAKGSQNMTGEGGCLMYMRTHSDDEFTAHDLAPLLGIPRRTAGTYLARLCQRGAIERVHTGRYRYMRRQLAA